MQLHIIQILIGEVHFTKRKGCQCSRYHTGWAVYDVSRLCCRS